MPIVDLMAISSSHFAKLKDFIQMQLPAGFPVKIGKILKIYAHTYILHIKALIIDSCRNPIVSYSQCENNIWKYIWFGSRSTECGSFARN